MDSPITPLCQQNFRTIVIRRKVEIFQGGVEIGDVDEKARKLRIPVSMDDTVMSPTDEQLTKLVGELGKRTA